MGTQKLDKALGTHITLDSTNIPDDVVVESDIGPGAITDVELATDAVIPVKIQADAVTTVKILNANVTNAKLAADIEGGKIDSFKSTGIDGTGSEANTAHGLARTPSIVIVYLTQKDTGTTVELIEGTHDGTNIKVNAPAECKYGIIAF